MSLAENDNADSWSVGVGFGGGIYVVTGFADGGQLVVEDQLILSLAYAVAVDDDVLWKGTIVPLLPSAETTFEHLF